MPPPSHPLLLCWSRVARPLVVLRELTRLVFVRLSRSAGHLDVAGDAVGGRVCEVEHEDSSDAERQPGGTSGCFDPIDQIDHHDSYEDERLVDGYDCGDIQPPVPPPATQMSTETPSKCDDASDRLDNGNGFERTPRQRSECERVMADELSGGVAEPLRHHGGLHRYH